MEADKIAELDMLIGKHYKFGASGPDSYDCYTFLVEAYKIMGIDISGYKYSKRSIKNGSYIVQAKDRCTEIRIEDLRLGDFIVLESDKGKPTHAGVCIDKNWFIHCTVSGSSRSRVSTWRNNILWCGRPKELMNA